MKYIVSKNSATVFTDRPYTLRRDAPRFKDFVDAILKLQDEREAVRIAETPVVQVALENEDSFEIVNGVPHLDNQPVIGPLAEKVKSLLREKLPISHFVNFVRNLRNNPSRRAAEELYSFLEYEELPITEDGCFIAYKGIDPDMFSVRGGDLKPIKGRTDALGRIYNGVGERIEVTRNLVDDNCNRTCSQGLHVGSYDYASNWGRVVVAVKVNPKDVVSIPVDCDCQKCRTCAYTVIEEISRKINSTVVDDNLEEVNSEYKELLEKVASHLERQEKNGVFKTSIRRIQKAVKMGSVNDILNIVDDLGYDTEVDLDNPTAIGLFTVYLD